MKKTLMIVVGVVAILLLSGTAVGYAMMKKEVTISFSDKEKKIRTSVLNGTLSDALENEGYDAAKLKKQYQPSKKWDSPIEKDDTNIQLACNCSVNLKVGSKKNEGLQTTQPTVGKLLKEQKVDLDNNDQMNAALDQKITNDLAIVIDKIEKRVQKKVEAVSFDVKKKKDEDIPKGEKKVTKKGKKGKSIYQVTAIYKNGKAMVTDKKLVDKVNPVTELVTVGSGDQTADNGAGGGEVASGSRIAGLKYERSMAAETTGYTASGNRTATGTVPHRGTVAVDPDVIPLGTKLYIPGYGKAVAEDTGGAVNGNIIDLFFSSEKEAIQWGRRNVKAYILK
ncbi:3D (Asp-Asp-Asp) domain-containing protein [Marininema mesophilum]|uniref:3D (Asp-Asp-Asp) domain-containing protein n=1 Tax=Marininema mesophilum TaxID=1048340 RepID=A0A1H2QMM0_9BACL|nr:3D domain-containing protein [Marininema mesophilum]SDW08402.1 3D (Asp-Asp-Asp) domain-containing protein [Marininema mesophilum]